MPRFTYKVKTAPVAMQQRLDEFPNFHKSGSVAGMKLQYYGVDAKLVRCGNYIYNVTSCPEIYDNL